MRLSARRGVLRPAFAGPRRRLAAALLAVVAAALAAIAVSGCGGDDQEVAAILNRAFREPIGSADVSLDATVQAHGIPQLERPARVRITGPYRTAGPSQLPALDWTVSLATGAQNIGARLVSTGDNAFVGLGGQTYEVGRAAVAQENAKLAKQSPNGNRRGLSALGIDPRGWLNDARREDDAMVAGVETTHVSAGVDLPKMLDDLNKVVDRAGGTVGGAAPAKLTAEQRQRIATIVKDPRFDVYVGKADGKLREISADLLLAVPPGQEAKAGGLRNGHVAFSLKLADVGAAQQITAPAAARPIGELRAQIQNLVGGGGAPGATAPTPDVKKFRRYAQCLKAAGSDRAAQKKCDALLR